MDLHAGLGDHGLISRHGFRHRPHISKALDRFGFVGKIIDVQVKCAVEVEGVAMQVGDGLTCFRQHGIGLQFAAVNFHKIAIVKCVVPAHIPLLDMNVAVIGDEQGLFLQGFVPGLFKGAHLSVKIVNHLVRRNPDIAMAFLELGRFLSRGPTGDVAERVVRSVDAVMVGDDKRHALSLDRARESVGLHVCDMTLIGPRPERPAFCAEFEKRIHGWHYRTMVTPGLSGLAQVTGGYDLLPKEKVVLDL